MRSVEAVRCHCSHLVNSSVPISRAAIEKSLLGECRHKEGPVSFDHVFAGHPFWSKCSTD